MKLIIILTLIFAGAALAGPNNPGPGSDQVVTIWTSQTLTSTAIESSASWPVGLDRGILLDVLIEGAESGDTVTITPTFAIPGGTAKEHYSVPQALTWTSGQRTDFALDVTPPPGVKTMHMAGVTTDTDGCTITVRAIGATGAR